MSDIINLTERRNSRERPDPEFIRKDDFGREMFTFTCSYTMDDGEQYGVDIWAYSIEDAQARVAGMRASLVVDGQSFTSFRA